MQRKISTLMTVMLLAILCHVQQVTADDFVFRAKEEAHPTGHEYGISITCLENQSNTLSLQVLMRGYGGVEEATQDRYPRLFSYLNHLGTQLPEDRSCTEKWKVYNNTWKGFSYVEPFPWQLFMPAILSADDSYAFRSTSEAHPKGYTYGVSITYLSGKYRVLVRGYSNNSKPLKEEWPELFVYKNSLISKVPPVNTPGEEWDEWSNTWKGFSRN